MKYNYRFIRRSNSEVDFHVHEVFYDKDGKITGWSKDPMYPRGNTPVELCCDIIRMSSAFHNAIYQEKRVKGKDILVEVKVNMVTGKLK